MSAESRQGTPPLSAPGGETGTTPTAALPAAQALTVAWPVRPALLVPLLELGVVLVIAVGLVGQLGSKWWPGFSHPEFSAGTNLYGEYNIPSVYNALLLLLPSVLFLTIGRAKRALSDPFWRTWRGLSWLFFFLTLDEYFALHDKLGAPIRNAFQLSGLLRYAWVIPYAALVLVVGIALIRFLLHLPAAIRRGLLLAGSIYVVGALGLEAFEAKLEELKQVSWGSFSMSSQEAMIWLIALEEFLEMSGLVLLLATLLRYIRQALPDLKIQVGLGRPPQGDSQPH